MVIDGFCSLFYLEIEGWRLFCPCGQGLFFWQLAELQSKVRSEVSSEYWLRLNCMFPDKQLFDWGIMRLPRPLYGIGDAFAMEADDQFRKKRDAEVIFFSCSFSFFLWNFSHIPNRGILESGHSRWHITSVSAPHFSLINQVEIYNLMVWT